MQSLNIEGLSDFENELEQIIRDSPSSRKELHERLGKIAKQDVDSEISKSGLKDSHNNIKDWQNVYVGSGGGYAAVRAEADKNNTGNNSKGAITNYLESGHKIRTPIGNNKNYSPKINKAYVDGYHFYKSAKITVESKILEEVENFVDELADRLEG